MQCRIGTRRQQPAGAVYAGPATSRTLSKPQQQPLPFSEGHFLWRQACEMIIARCALQDEGQEAAASTCLFCRSPCEPTMFTVEPMWRCGWCRCAAHVRCYHDAHQAHNRDAIKQQLPPVSSTGLHQAFLRICILALVSRTLCSCLVLRSAAIRLDSAHQEGGIGCYEGSTCS